MYINAIVTVPSVAPSTATNNPGINNFLSNINDIRGTPDTLDSNDHLRDKKDLYANQLAYRLSIPRPKRSAEISNDIGAQLESQYPVETDKCLRARNKACNCIIHPKGRPQLAVIT